MTDIIFSFDVEDLANVAGFDGILRSAELLRGHNVRGCFQTVGRLAELLEQRGRQDVIEAMKYHEIGTHSLAHSVHPTINECTDLEDYEAAKAALLPQETQCKEILQRIFGVDALPSACPPGNSVSYVAHYLYGEMGIPVYCGDLVSDPVRGRPVSYCNLLCTGYDLAAEFYLIERDEHMRAVRVRSEEEIRARVNEIAETKDLFVIYHHPSMSMYSEWWDMVNCCGDTLPAHQWRECERLPQEITELYYERFSFLVRLIKEDPRFRITTYEGLARQYGGPRLIRRKEIPALKAQLEESFFPVTLPHSYCLADLFHACRAFLCGEEEHLCGRVFGFLEEPFAISSPVTVTKEQLIQSAKRISPEGWLPRSIVVGSSILGAADWLRAALSVLSGAEVVTVSPGPWQIPLDQFPGLRDMDLSHSWVNVTHLEDLHLSRRARLQTWTIFLPEGTNRAVF